MAYDNKKFKYTQKDLVHAMETFLGIDPVRAMIQSNISTPRIHELAIVKAFMGDTSGKWEEDRILREAWRDLYKGQYQFTEEQ